MFIVPYCAQTLLHCIVFCMNNCFGFIETYWNILLCSVDVTGIKWLLLGPSFSTTYNMVLHFEVLHFPVQYFPVPHFLVPCFPALTFWSFIFWPCICHFWSHLVLHFPVLYFQLTCSGISWNICKSSALCSRQKITAAPYHSILWARCSSWRPTNSVKWCNMQQVSNDEDWPANERAWSVETARKCLRSFLLPTSMTTMLASAWSRSSLNQRSTFSNVRCLAMSYTTSAPTAPR